MTSRGAGRIVVGVDGTVADGPVIAWAAREARQRGATVELVHALHLPKPARDPLGLATLGLDHEALRIEARAVLAVAGELVREHAANVRVEIGLSDGPAVIALVDASKDALMLVVGARHATGLSGVVTGSVANGVLHRAPCPVVIVSLRHDD